MFWQVVVCCVVLKCMHVQPCITQHKFRPGMGLKYGEVQRNGNRKVSIFQDTINIHPAITLTFIFVSFRLFALLLFLPVSCIYVPCLHQTRVYLFPVDMIIRLSLLFRFLVCLPAFSYFTVKSMISL